MTRLRRTLARAVVRASAWLAPAGWRSRLREEWLAELDAVPPDRSIVRTALGAPRDALACWAERRRRRLGPPGHRFGLDLRHSLRLLAASPGHVVAVVLALSVGLTATVIAFSAVDTIVWGDPPGVRDRQTVTLLQAALEVRGGSGVQWGFSAKEFEALQHHGPLIRAVAAEVPLRTTVRIGPDAMSVSGAFVSGSFFQMLGTEPVAGRLIEQPDDRADAGVVVVSERFWRRHLGGRRAALGRIVTIGDLPLTVAGVVPDGFRGLWNNMSPPNMSGAPPVVDVYVPLALAQAWPSATAGSAQGNPHWLTLAARLAPGLTVARDGRRALEPLDAVFSATIGRTARLQPSDLVLGRMDANDLASFVVVVLAGPVALLLLGCANVANLRLARATSRTHEVAVRLALGATRGQVMRLLGLESALMTGLALGVSGVATRMALMEAAGWLPLGTRMDWTAALFAVALAAAAVGLSGLAPAWLVVRRVSARALTQTPRTGGLAHARLRSGLVVAQVAISLVLLAIGGLFARSLQTIEQARPAALDHLVVANLYLGSAGYDSNRAAQFSADLLDRLAHDAGVQAAGLADASLLSGGRQLSVRLPGESRDTRGYAGLTHVTPGWFATMALQPLAGRTLTRADGAGVAVVSRSLARTITPDRSPVGMTLLLRPDSTKVWTPYTIVGIVPDEVQRPVRLSRPRQSIYAPLGSDVPLNLSLYVSADRPSAAIGALNRTIAGIDPRMPWTDIRTGADIFSQANAPTRLLAETVSGLGLVALALAAAGLFAVMAYAVSLRTREIGIRMALGADGKRIAKLVGAGSVRLVAVGTALGLVVALPLAHLMRVAFLGVSPFDPVALGPAVGVLLLAAAAASLWPARRAARVDPLHALHED